MGHLGCNLLPAWPILRPSWDHLRPNFAKNLSHIAPEVSSSAPRHPKTTQRVAKELQDSPLGSNFYGVGVDFGPHFQSFFFTVSCNSSWPPCLKFGTVVALRAQRIGSAAPAKQWSGVCKSGVRSCQNPISNSPERLHGVHRARSGGNGSLRSERASINFATSVGHRRPFWS